MTDDPYFEIVPPRAAEPSPPSTPPLAEGVGWRVEQQADGLWLFYVSPSHQGDMRAVLIGDEEADGLAAGSRTLDQVLIARGAD